MERRKFLKYATLAGSGFTFAGCTVKRSNPLVEMPTPASPIVANEALKVAFVYPGSVRDFGWTYVHDLGRREMEANLQAKVKTTFVENVNEGADSERVIRQLAIDGHKLIFTTALGYMNSTIKVAKSFPHILFENCAGYKRENNVGTYLGRSEEPRYLTGMIAGKMTKSNLIGFIGSYPIPEVIRGISAFTQGLRATNPQAKVRVVWAQTWNNPTKEREAAHALLDSGADILTHHTNSSAVVQFAEEKGIYAFGYNTDMSQFGAKAHLTSCINKWGKFYTDQVQTVIDGTWKSQNIWDGIAQDMVDISSLNPEIPEDVQQLAIAKRDEFIHGTAHPFDGPVKDQKGVLRVPAGKVLNDQQQLVMNWYVEGVEGSVAQKR
ncbi:BMP family ABC transporter substrate-binding protein [Aetokthonos hydrillicola Thurmond2011]|jgi:simple sugar transport system substrate-binding protein|uniref:BMP family ABC transporter substrate-binding protein n=1 Tax=Aetokthonos hydrillicola Thurmond2011 TaxID=2712845 RepID=A0AAP5IE73_9CYAN|nr:BMP family ABC transporter substrate-binding protein [Aetokthonos hydrillicola]MBO3459605.1 BMP family ABC transporter substrate-binding protein [Aetokthonos hydrillicola CCALA 1050]MBW4588967.1 BMP family ABC transporter substrate-binding protein [Aetokthonos hydrillicola CCALA 1050]MDR9900040.1 BMP family ABC transporter substrate-binding protein [Aetokthonos hydrillicola Thurmond2011]